VPQGQVPRLVTLKIDYYQLDSVEKLVIKIILDCSLFYTPTQEELKREVSLSYQLAIVYHSMHHSELVNEFALTWDIYMILYIFIGLFSAAEVLIFYFYHVIVYRGDSKISLNFRCYFIIFGPIFKGMMLAIFILTIPLSVTSIVMLGEFWDEPFPYDSGCIEGEKCRLSVFDMITNSFKLDDPYFIIQRKGRCGVALFVIGIYIVYLVSAMIVPEDQQKHFLGEVSFDFNIWQNNSWKRSHFIFISCIMICYYTIIIQFSFSAMIGLNPWTSLIAIKLIQFVLEELLKVIFQDDLLFNPNQIFINTVQGVAMMAAADFFDFLFGYFIGLGLQIFER
jgi:hypothetical protein